MLRGAPLEMQHPGPSGKRIHCPNLLTAPAQPAVHCGVRSPPLSPRPELTGRLGPGTALQCRGLDAYHWPQERPKLQIQITSSTQHMLSYSTVNLKYPKWNHRKAGAFPFCKPDLFLTVAFGWKAVHDLARDPTVVCAPPAPQASGFVLNSHQDCSAEAMKRPAASCSPALGTPECHTGCPDAPPRRHQAGVHNQGSSSQLLFCWTPQNKWLPVGTSHLFLLGTC